MLISLYFAQTFGFLLCDPAFSVSPKTTIQNDHLTRRMAASCLVRMRRTVVVANPVNARRRIIARRIRVDEYQPLISWHQTALTSDAHRSQYVVT